MATTNDEHQFDSIRIPFLQPLSPRVPPSIDRHFQQYLVDHHHYPKLPSIGKFSNRQTNENFLTNEKFLLTNFQHENSTDFENNNGPISRLLNSENYRRSQERLIQYRQKSLIPGVALETNSQSNYLTKLKFNGRKDFHLPLNKNSFNEPLKIKQEDDLDLVSDDSIKTNGTERRQRAKHWIKEHQFFFTEFQ